MYLRDFQICLRKHDSSLYKRARETWTPIEDRIRRRIPKRCDFGGIKKLVIEVGPEAKAKPPYRVLLDVGLTQYPDFEIDQFLQQDEAARVQTTLNMIEASITQLATRFGSSADWLLEELSDMRQKQQHTKLVE
jgi:hypothetical protein